MTKASKQSTKRYSYSTLFFFPSFKHQYIFDIINEAEVQFKIFSSVKLQTKDVFLAYLESTKEKLRKNENVYMLFLTIVKQEIIRKNPH